MEMSKDMNEYNVDDWEDWWLDNPSSTIREKFSPDTHQTRCGESWRWLDIKGQDAIAVYNQDKGESILLVDGNGYTYWSDGTYEFAEHHLIPIQQPITPPVDIPTNLRSDIKYAAMDEYGNWEASNNKYKISTNIHVTDHWYTSSLRHSLSCFGIPKDPAGWENSLHKRVGDLWERVV